MTTETRFDVDEWTGRLGASLEATAAAAEFSLRLEGDHGAYLAHHEVLALQEDAKRRLAVRDAIVSSRVRLVTSEMAEPRAILRKHPILRRALTGTGDDESLMLLGPGSTALVSSLSLAMHLIRLSTISNGTEAARLLDRYLTVGESRQLEAREIIVIYGLKLAGRIDLGKGSFLAPLGDQFIS